MLWTVHLDGGPELVNHTAVLVKDNIYSFGGDSNSVIHRFDDPIAVYILNTNTLRWSKCPQQCNANGALLKYPAVPFNRSDLTAVVYNEEVYIWGGRSDMNVCNILYCFNPCTATWSRPSVSGIVPRGRDGHSACVNGHFMYIFGGFVDGNIEYSAEVHSLNFLTFEWSTIQTVGSIMLYRDLHAAVVMNDRMYVFGGRGDKHSPYHNQEETYCHKIAYLDLKTNIWHRPLSSGKIPMGRHSHCMFIYNDLIYVFGGYNGHLDKHFNDFYSYNPRTNVWTFLRPHGLNPICRNTKCAVVKDNRMFLFGGICPFSIDEDIQFSTLDSIDAKDTHVLDFSPSLKTLALSTVLKHKLDISSLPDALKEDIRLMTQSNHVPNQYDY